MRIGVISDTHGQLRPQAVTALQGCESILHAGDIGHPDIVPYLEQTAPVYAVRGNVDTKEVYDHIPWTQTLELGGLRIHMVHILRELAVDPVTEGIDLVVFGHSHKPEFFEKDGVFYLNPGSAGRRRFSLPVTLALLETANRPLDVEFVDLIG